MEGSGSEIRLNSNGKEYTELQVKQFFRGFKSKKHTQSFSFTEFVWKS